jgi:4-hydroxy-tetrahydrodipicolinate synthase
MPKEAVALCKMIATGKLTNAVDLWKRMLPAQLFFWTHDYNASIKAATNLCGRKIGECRKPQQPLKESDMALLRNALDPLFPAASHAAQ